MLLIRPLLCRSLPEQMTFEKVHRPKPGLLSGGGGAAGGGVGRSPVAGPATMGACGHRSTLPTVHGLLRSLSTQRQAAAAAAGVQRESRCRQVCVGGGLNSRAEGNRHGTNYGRDANGGLPRCRPLSAASYAARFRKPSRLQQAEPATSSEALQMLYEGFCSPALVVFQYRSEGWVSTLRYLKAAGSCLKGGNQRNDAGHRAVFSLSRIRLKRSGRENGTPGALKRWVAGLASRWSPTA